MKYFISVFALVAIALIYTQSVSAEIAIQLDPNALGFEIPTLGDILTFAIRAFFAISGVTALFYMLMGALAWIVSGGDKDNVSAAQNKIVAAVVGVLVIVAVLAIIWTLEQGVFSGKICFGLSCPLSIPALLPQ